MAYLTQAQISQSLSQLTMCLGPNLKKSDSVRQMMVPSQSDDTSQSLPIFDAVPTEFLESFTAFPQWALSSVSSKVGPDT